MRFPKWAREDDRSKVRYLISLLALEVDPAGNKRALAKAVGVKYDTLSWNYRYHFSSKIAEKVCLALPESGIKPYWLTNPSWIKIDEETGEIIE